MEEIGDKQRAILASIQKQLDNYDGNAIREKQKKIEESLFNFANFIESKIVLFYVNVGGEVPTEEIMKRSLKQKKIIAMPSFTEEKGVEEVYRVENPEKDLIRNENGRLEPDRTRCKPIPMEQVDIAIIPGLAFDEKGGRIGQNSGFYSRLMGKLSITTRKIAIAYEEQVVPQIPMDAKGKYIDIILTDDRTIYKI